MTEMTQRRPTVFGTQAPNPAARDTWRMLAVAVGVAATPVAAWASVFTAPSGLAPGSSYRLMFLTADQTAGSSNDITTYNSFVNTEAQQNPLLPQNGWTAIVSTPTNNAIDNTDGGSTSSAAYTSDPVFMVNGSEVTTSLSDFFASAAFSAANNFSSSLIINPLTLDQNGSSAGGYIWSGSNPDGSTATGNEMGSSAPATWGFNPDGSPYSAFPTLMGNTSLLSVIAISAPIEVGTPVPEPASGPLFATGAAMLAALGLRRRSRSRA